MMLARFFFLILFTDSTLSKCTYRDVVRHLNLTTKKDVLTLTQPVSNIKQPLVLELDVLLYAILDVNEKEQLFVSYIWVDVIWMDELLSWNSSAFCGIEEINIPTKSVWTPDITIIEMTEKDKAAPSPYLTVLYNGQIELRNDMVVVSSCNMQIYKFPFDTQRCHLTFKSVMHSDMKIRLNEASNNNWITKWSRKVMRSKAEWRFLKMKSFIRNNDNFGINQSMVVYTITMARRPILYIVNFILPVLLLLCLDLASFMMPEGDSGKVGFKISVLLAVILMQLLLNEILPSSSTRIPLIVTYCIGIFGFMMLSLLETILMICLMGKDSATKDKEAENQSLSEECAEKQGSTKLCSCFRDNELITSTSDWPAGETSSELLQVEKEVSGKQPSEGSSVDEKSVIKALSLLRKILGDTKKIDYWTRLAKRIHRVFIVFYILTITLFLAFMFYIWTNG